MCISLAVILISVTSLGHVVETETVAEEELQTLRQFDLDWRFGPCTGNTVTPFTEITNDQSRRISNVSLFHFHQPPLTKSVMQ